MTLPRVVLGTEGPSPLNFLKGAVGFTKNPLGIIGLFVVLIYGLAVIVAGFSPELTEFQRWVMIALIATFPPGVLWTFYRLVTKHHAKLYAPGDWKDEKNFLVAMGSAARRRQLKAEAQEVLAAESGGGPKIGKLPASSHAQDREQLMSLIRNAEVLALDELENRFSLEITRDVRLGGSEIVVDGLSEDAEGGGILFEVKVIRDEPSADRILSAAARTANLIEEWLETSPHFSLSLVLVTVGLDEDAQQRLADHAEQRLADLYLDHSVVVFDLDELRGN